MMKKPKRIEALPKAAVMLESLRGLGYSLPGALADIIDNSIAAHATQIDLDFHWDGAASFLTIIDDGHGMSSEELYHAMLLGDRDPLGVRASSDLGRFGLGLKTASFSQCRRLTVASRREAVDLACLRWDLDELVAAEGGGWFLIEGAAPGSERLLDRFRDAPHGTLALWEVLDRVVGGSGSQQHFLDAIDRVESHLAMVFHRYLEGPSPRLRIKLNGRKIEAWDPFLSAHAATWTSPNACLFGSSGRVDVQCHVLPHKDRLSGTQHDLAAGPHGWTAQQGFYVYRNQRMLLAGSWLGLGPGRAWTKEEAHRLARIRLDIPNTADSEWKIDIRKSVARPPASLRNELVRLAEDTRERARKVFAHRGQIVRVGGGEVAQAWRTEHHKGGLRYRVDENHPAVRAVLEDAGESRARIRHMLRVIEESLPVQRIWLDTTEGKETPRTGFAGEPTSEVKEILGTLYHNLTNRKGMSPDLAKTQLLKTEPFHNFPELIMAL